MARNSADNSRRGNGSREPEFEPEEIEPPVVSRDKGPRREAPTRRTINADERAVIRARMDPTARNLKRGERAQAHLAEERELAAKAQAKKDVRDSRKSLARRERAERRAYAKEHAVPGRLTSKHRAIIVVILVVLAFAILYPTARTYYITVRNNQRLEAVLAAQNAIADNLQAQIDELNTAEGIEDAARTDQGWVKQGEESVSVVGAKDDDGDGEDSGTIDLTKITAPKTWYYTLLDVFFLANTDEPVVNNSASGDNTGNSSSNLNK